jgi:hypothetical protein
MNFWNFKMENEIGKEKTVHNIGTHFGPRPRGHNLAKWAIRGGVADGGPPVDRRR